MTFSVDESTQEEALARAVRVGEEAADLGFDWADALDASTKVAEELAELQEAVEDLEDPEILEELGDLLFAVCNVARKLGIDPGVALDAASDKFERRFGAMLDALAEDGHEPSALTLDELERYWQRTKRR